MNDRAVVPCGSCSLCCRRGAIMLFPEEGDDVASYEHQIVTLAGIGTGPILKKGADGNCIYLVEGRCSIWERAPKICRTFDCRRHYLGLSRAERRRMAKMGRVDQEIFEAGRQRLHTLGEDS